MKKVLIVDDEAEVRVTLKEIVTGAGYHVDEASSGREAVEKASLDRIDVVLLDLMMPDMDGIEVLGEIKRVSPRTKIIIVTAFATVGSAIDSIKKGASDCVSKPFRVEEILNTISRVLEEARFDEGMKKMFMDNTMTALNNSVRRNIIKLLNERKSMRLMEIANELKIDDHTKVSFHLKILKDTDIIEQNRDRFYVLTREGKKVFECLKIMENYFVNE